MLFYGASDKQLFFPPYKSVADLDGRRVISFNNIRSRLTFVADRFFFFSIDRVDHVYFVKIIRLVLKFRPFFFSFCDVL